MSFLEKNQSFYKSYFSMTLVIALQNLVVYSVSLADNVMLAATASWLCPAWLCATKSSIFCR